MSAHEHLPPHVLAPDRLSACEGRCGVTLMPAAAEHAPHEIAYVLELPSAVELIAAHTPARCRAIRALREAGERAAGEGGSAFVCAHSYNGIELFIVRAWDANENWAESWPLVTIALTSPSIAESVEDGLRYALGDLSGVGDFPPTPAPIIARDPHLGLSRSEWRS